MQVSFLLLNCRVPGEVQSLKALNSLGDGLSRGPGRDLPWGWKSQMIPSRLAPPFSPDTKGKDD